MHMFLVKKVLVIAILVALTNSIASESDITETPSGTQRYCGKNLVNVLTLVCGGIYNNQMAPKEDDNASPLRKAPSNMFRDKRSVVTIFQRSTRHRRGAYDECCRKGCSLDEMVGYCGVS